MELFIFLQPHVTDYFIDIVNNLNTEYKTLEYNNYEDLIGKEITYNDNVLFIIGGIIKTDYKEYYNESGNLRDKYNYRNEKDIASFNSHRVIIEYKLEYEYKAIYATSDSYNSINIQKPYMYYYDTDNTINIHSDINNKDLDYLSFEFSDNKKVVYLDNSGEVNSTVETGSKQKYKDIDDGIIISGDLYNAIFGVIIDWESFSSRYWDKYYFGEDETVYYKNNIKYLGKTINISIKNAFGDVILDIKNQKIVGIDLDSCNKRNDNDYYIIGKQKSLNITNQDLIEVYTQRISYKDIESKVKLLKNLRKENILVMGSESKIIYEQEETLRSFSYFFIGVSTILVILTIISILNLINSKINDNKKEIGILMGIGFDGKEIIFIYLFSIMFLTIVSIILNICLMYIGIAVINRLMQVSPFTNLVFFSVDIMTYITLLSTGIIIILFGLIPLLSFSKKKPIDIITK